MNFEEWKKTGPLLIKALRDRGEEESFRTLLADLYPKKAHFIYELFQNAEDAGATSCKFNLTTDQLIFSHNGKPFTEANVRSITSFGKSLKKDDPTAIGQFGVGFKAVFAYTDTPEIHSGEYNFQIHSLIVYSEEGVKKVENGNITKFIFPFNSLHKPKTQAYEEIKNVLKNLEDNTLLFLSSINLIEYEYGSSTGSLRRIDGDDEITQIINSKPKISERTTNWLRFDKVVAIAEDNSIKNCRISAAFLLGYSESDKKNKLKIIPHPKGEVSIYFPAEKEVSNFAFHIHAPFASTVARDSIRDSRSNELLRDALALLLAEKLERIKEIGLLDFNMLESLPNSSDQLSNFYQPIAESIRMAFKTKPLVPTTMGGYFPGNELYFGPSEIQKVIKDADLAILLNKNIPLWSANPEGEGRAVKFIEDLDMNLWSWDQLCETFMYPDSVDLVEQWVASKSNSELLSLYALLGKAIEVHECMFYENDIKMFRIEGGNLHSSASNLFLESDDEINSNIEGVKYLSAETYGRDSKSASSKYAKRLVAEVGIKIFDKREEIKKKLEFYSGGGQISVKDHIIDLRLFLEFYKKNPNMHHIFSNINFLLTESSDTLTFDNAKSFYIDEPYELTHLNNYELIHRKKPIFKQYFSELSYEEIFLFTDLLKKLGAYSCLSVVRQSTNNNPERSYLQSGYGRSSSNKVDIDFSIQFLRRYLKSIDEVSSRLIWNAVISAGSECSLARYRVSGRQDEKISDSILIHILREAKWIINKNGDFFSPDEITKDELRSEFIYDDRNGLLSKLNFGNKSLLESSEFNSFKSHIEKHGLSIDDFNAVLSFIKQGGSISDLQKTIHIIDDNSNPTGSVLNPERRRELVIKEIEESPDISSTLKVRNIQSGMDDLRDRAKQYLRAQYQNLSGILNCQCCRREMPFKLQSSGEYYFEATQFIKDQTIRFHKNRLALCPNCNAMYAFAREDSDEMILHNVLELEFNDKDPFIEFEVRLAGKTCRLYFVGKHFFDIREMFSKIRTG